jgi:hypothetical protein
MRTHIDICIPLVTSHKFRAVRYSDPLSLDIIR